ncbi:MAG: hypothetical protein KIT48_06555 [Pseudolabrys sp.]|nr:hypothetical protein [Pseudolabrys sp.]
MTKSIRSCAFAVLALLACAVSGARADDISIIGRWEIVEAMPAPWTKPEERSTLVARGRGLTKLVITFAPNSVSSKFKLFQCKRGVDYDHLRLQVDALFQGNLPEPNPTAEARRLGFPRGDIPSVDVRCINAVFSFHFRDRDTALFALDNVIYTLKRR